MSERLSGKTEVEVGKYSSPRDQVLDAMAKEGWANASGGEVTSVSGWFARISNSPAELQEVLNTFEDQMNEAGLADPNELLGHFMVVEDDKGFVTVTRHEDEQALLTDFAVRQQWDDGWQDEGTEVERIREYNLVRETRAIHGEAFDHWVEHMGLEDVDTSVAQFKEKFIGKFDDMEVFARHIISERGHDVELQSLLLQFPEDLRQYVKIDYEDYGDDVYTNYLVAPSNNGNGLYIYNY